jgi:hypothetical protein
MVLVFTGFHGSTEGDRQSPGLARTWFTEELTLKRGMGERKDFWSENDLFKGIEMSNTQRGLENCQWFSKTR